MAEVPISEVLCNATEYLCKLGSNLRSRSQNLKDKRINKDKLKNIHAIRKAATKLLLMCDLSKKSLDNVESGVKKVLTVVDASMCSSSVGAKNKNSSSKLGESPKKCFYFEYDSCKLRISKKIFLNHYTSVRVRAKNMPPSMVEKYPVYYNCSLYQKRKKSKESLKKEGKDKSKKVDKMSEESPLSEDAVPSSNLKEPAGKESKEETDEIESSASDNKKPSNKERCSKSGDSLETMGPSTDVNIKESVSLEKGNDNVSASAGSDDDSKSDELVQTAKTTKRKINEESLEKTKQEPKKTLDCKEKNKQMSDNEPSDEEKDSVKPTGNTCKTSKEYKKKVKTEEKVKENSKKQSSEHINQKRASTDSDKSSGTVKEDGKNKEGLVSDEIKQQKEDRKKLSESDDDSKKQSKETKENNEQEIIKSPVVEDETDSSTQKESKKKNKERKLRAHLESEDQPQNILESHEISETESESQDKGKVKDNEKKNKKCKRSLSIISSDEGSDSTKSPSKNVPDKNQKKRKLSNEKKTSENEIINLLDDESPMKSGNSNQANDDDKNDSSGEKRPKIKLVSLSKLLKPDIVRKDLMNSEDNTVKKSVVVKKYTNKKSKMEQSYWEEKRKEVNAFKPKQFDVVVTRLTKYSNSFLQKHGLKKITSNGSVIYSLSKSVVDKENVDLEISETLQNLKRLRKQDKEICKTINIDLTDNTEEDKNNLNKGVTSDSDSTDKNMKLNDLTGKETSTKQTSETENQNTCKDSGEHHLKSSGNDKKDEHGQNENLSNDSGKDDTTSVDPPKTPESKNLKTDETTPRSKRKVIMESMRAKKMLLTYSSSSDTEDEQLRSALSEIKSSLLHGSSDDEIDVKKIVQMNRRKLNTSSDSDDSLKINARKLKQRKEDRFEETEKDDDTNISQVDGTNDEHSDSSSSQMGRSKTKVASSNNQSSEKMDSNDIEINRLADLKSLTRSRRRRSSGDAPKTKTRSTKKLPKAPPIETEMLAPESSDSLSDSDPGPAEELPPIPLQELNGDGINHQAKEDLLAQSDSSSSQNDKENGTEEEKKDDSDEDEEEENVKSRRRKPNAISSESEAGSARQRTGKISDFEDSDDESEPRKNTKRKKKGSDSDASQSSNDGSKKKRRRIKQVNDSEGSGSDTENEGKNKHGRKNIRKVMGKDQLEEATKKAARQEKERIARIAERQKLYNNLEFDESGKPDEVVLEKVVLDFDPDTKEPLIEVDRGLVKKLKPHQANGIKFMWNACFESVKRIKKDRGSGCILAHCMGLGKTLQVVSLTHTLLTHSSLTGVQRVLVVCPLSTVLNWVNEFTMWLKHARTDFEVNVFELSRHKQNSERSWQLQQWVECGGVCVLGYEMFRNLSADNNKKFKKKMLKTFQEALVDPGPDLVVCDEGHLLKNEKTSLSQSMNRVRTLRRIVLTGTPLQNNLKEYYCMVQFVKPNLLGKYNEYLNRFVNPITNGQYTDSTERDISIMKRRSHVLHTMLDGAVQRRDYGVLAPFLPPKHEYVLFITLTEIQTKLYQHYLDNYSRRPLPGKSSGFLFPDFQSLQRIWTHPLVLKYNSERYEIMQQKKRDKEEEDSEGSLADFIDDESTPEESSTEESSDDLSDASDDSRKKSKKKKSAKKGKGKDSKASGRRNTRANPVELEEEKPSSDVEEVKYENPTEWWMKLVTDEELEDMRHSHKLLLLFDILRQCEAIGDKLLVFSQSLYSLDLIEHFLGKVDEATQDGRIDEKLAGHVGSWSPGVDYFRLDGSTSCENRSIWCKNFNREDNPRARLFLISTRAGGLGINLVAANRVVIFDVSWNPSHDVQSIFRVYRFGQKKPCYVYRFIAMGTMEEKIYERQVTKQAISKRVIDEQQIDRHYAANDLAELYKFEPVPQEPRPVPKLPKDRLFAEMLKDHEKQIFRFHEHDSLLENKEEETLSEEERKRAWEEFENEKRAPPPSPFPNTWAMHNGMASLIQQQQQQLAYAALAAMIRKDMPNVNDAQIRDMLPIICNANPGIFGGYDYGLMQKMTEIYKYAQPGVMNPSMMNPVMNPAAGGMSTSTSLQYEPPWQRQQQQQQQMRLQQLMQQQQSMGAKYYAGGLGSRDPVAMALQQQRAREFLLGPGGGASAGGAGRPRGRPPLQPRAPPAAPDVVNLADSD